MKTITVQNIGANYFVITPGNRKPFMVMATGQKNAALRGAEKAYPAGGEIQVIYKEAPVKKAARRKKPVKKARKNPSWRKRDAWTSKSDSTGRFLKDKTCTETMAKAIKWGKSRKKARMNPTSIPTQAQYEQNEAIRLRAEIRATESASLADRKDAAKDMKESLLEGPERLERELDFIHNGDYGFGAQKEAENISKMVRGNRNARIFQLVSALAFRVPARMANDVFNSLTAEQKRKTNSILTASFPGKKAR
jgi:hypothetical protein